MKPSIPSIHQYTRQDETRPADKTGEPPSYFPHCLSFIHLLVHLFIVHSFISQLQFIQVTKNILFYCNQAQAYNSRITKRSKLQRSSAHSVQSNPPHAHYEPNHQDQVPFLFISSIHLFTSWPTDRKAPNRDQKVFLQYGLFIMVNNKKKIPSFPPNTRVSNRTPPRCLQNVKKNAFVVCAIVYISRGQVIDN